MKTLMVALLAFITIHLSAFESGGENKSNSQAALIGKVTDQVTGEALAGVAVKVEGTDIVAYTNFDGQFEIENMKPGSYDVCVSYISYEEKENAISLEAGKQRELKMDLAAIKE